MRDGGTSTWYEQHYPFGEIINEEVLHAMTAGAGDMAMSWKPNFRFPGQYEDSDMGTAANSRPLFVQNHYREYMPRFGRYNRVDPLQNVLKTYFYSMNNPFSFIDRKGLFVECDDDDCNKPKIDDKGNWIELLCCKLTVLFHKSMDCYACHMQCDATYPIWGCDKCKSLKVTNDQCSDKCYEVCHRYFCGDVM